MSSASMIRKHGVTATIMRPVEVEQDGRVVTTLNPIATLTIFLSTRSSSRREFLGAQRNSVGYRVYAPAGTDLRMGDRIEFMSGPDKRVLKLAGPIAPGEATSGPLARVQCDADEELPRG